METMELSSLIPYASAFIGLIITVASVLAFRQSYSKTAGEIQDRVIKALKEETETLTKKIEDCEERITRQNQIIETIQAALQAQGIIIKIDGDLVTIEEAATRKTTVRKAVKRQNQGQGTITS